MRHQARERREKAQVLTRKIFDELISSGALAIETLVGAGTNTLKLTCPAKRANRRPHGSAVMEW